MKNNTIYLILAALAAYWLFLRPTGGDTVKDSDRDLDTGVTSPIGGLPPNPLDPVLAGDNAQTPPVIA